MKNKPSEKMNSPYIKKSISCSQLPSKEGRYVVVDTESTGPNPDKNNIIEIACVEIENGKITGNEFHAFLHPRYKMDMLSEQKTKLTNNFYNSFFNNVYFSDKKCLELFKAFIGNSIIFAHNATVDFQFINNELKYWGISIIPKKRFRCTLKLFRTLFPEATRNYCTLSKCCSFFNIASPSENFHSAIFDSFMTARLVCKLFENLDKAKNLKEKEEKHSSKKIVSPPQTTEKLKIKDNDNKENDLPIQLEINDIDNIINEI